MRWLERADVSWGQFHTDISHGVLDVPCFVVIFIASFAGEATLASFIQMRRSVRWGSMSGSTRVGGKVRSPWGLASDPPLQVLNQRPCLPNPMLRHKRHKQCLANPLQNTSPNNNPAPTLTGIISTRTTHKQAKQPPGVGVGTQEQARWCLSCSPRLDSEAKTHSDQQLKMASNRNRQGGEGVVATTKYKGARCLAGAGQFH